MATSPKSKPISIAEPVTDLRKIKIVECGEPLVDYREACPLLVLDQPVFKYRRETMVRASVAEFLDRASRSLPTGYRMAIMEGWRAPHIQRRMWLGVYKRFQEQNPHWSETKLKRVTNRYTAPLSVKVPPPHSTGGAVDVMLVRDDGSYHDHCNPFERFDDRCFAFAAPGLGEEAIKTRSIIAAAFAATGMTNYPSEYWHWSYGDQGWAYRGGHPHALYGPVVPEAFEPDPNDLGEEPFEFIER